MISIIIIFYIKYWKICLKILILFEIIKYFSFILYFFFQEYYIFYFLYIINLIIQDYVNKLKNKMRLDFNIILDKIWEFIKNIYKNIL